MIKRTTYDFSRIDENTLLVLRDAAIDAGDYGKLRAIVRELRARGFYDEPNARKAAPEAHVAGKPHDQHDCPLCRAVNHPAKTVFHLPL